MLDTLRSFDWWWWLVVLGVLVLLPPRYDPAIRLKERQEQERHAPSNRPRR